MTRTDPTVRINPPPRWVWLRHQLGAATATVVDFCTMVALVRWLALPATWATAAGASLGALTNFTLARRWIFESRATAVSTQAVRYAIVALGSLGLNVLGEWILHDRQGVHYVVARACVALCVSLMWNYPLHERFVFAANS